MTAERKQIPVVVAAMLGIVLSDPEALLFGYALAASKGDEDSLEIAKFYKKEPRNSELPKTSLKKPWTQ